MCLLQGSAHLCNLFGPDQQSLRAEFRCLADVVEHTSANQVLADEHDVFCHADGEDLAAARVID